MKKGKALGIHEIITFSGMRKERHSGDVGANSTFEYEGWVGRCEMVTSDESGIVSSAEVKSLGFRLAYCYKYLRIKCARFKLACVML
jgi:hypothetical protein